MTRLPTLKTEAAGVDLGSMYAVQEVLTAEITEQTCGRLDAHGNFVGVGSAELDLAGGCARTSMEPVAVAYRTTPVEDLVALYSSTADEVQPQAGPATRAPADSVLASLLSLDLEARPQPAQPPAVSVAEALQLAADEERPVLIGAEGIDWSSLARGMAQAQEARDSDPTGRSIYDSLTFRDRDEKLPWPAAEPAVVASAAAEVLAAGAADIAACGGAVQGRWRLSFTVDARGRPQGIQISGWDRPDGAVEACIAGVAADWGFEPPPEPYQVVKSYVFGE